jgi:predicted transcriptional regulator
MTKGQLAQSAIQSYLLLHGPGKTSQIAKSLNLSSVMVRRAGLKLADKSIVKAERTSGQGKGEYLFSCLQGDLFQDTPKSKTLWHRIRSLFQ